MMGTDIHPYLEIKCGREWRFVPISLQSDRNYEVFGFLSGVRGTEGPFDENCVGAFIPEFASKEVVDAWDGGQWGHTPTVVDVAALRSVANDKNMHYVVNWLKIMERFLELGADDARVILWYDS